MENSQGLELAGAGLGLPQAGLAGVVGERGGQGQAKPCRLEHWRTPQKVLVQLSDSARWFPKNLVPFATSLLESLISSGPEVKQTYRQTYTPEGPDPTF